MRRLRPPLIARCTKTITTPQSSQSRIARFSLNNTPTEWPLSRSVRSSTVTPTPSRLVLKKSVGNSKTPALKQVSRRPTLLHQSLLASTCTTMFMRSVFSSLILEMTPLTNALDHPANRPEGDYSAISRPYHCSHSRDSSK